MDFLDKLTQEQTIHKIGLTDFRTFSLQLDLAFQDSHQDLFQIQISFDDTHIKIEYLDEVFWIHPVHNFERLDHKLEITLSYADDENRLDFIDLAKLYMDANSTCGYFELPVPNKQNAHISFDDTPYLFKNLRHWLAKNIHNHLFKGDAS